jgi:taurine dioxygenase
MSELTTIEERPLAEGISFGARISGVDSESVKDERVRQRIKEIYEDRGLIVFENVAPSTEMQLALSDIFGPPQDHPYNEVPRLNQDTMPGVIDLNSHPSDADIYEVDGKQQSGWLPWHYDACYTGKLNRGAVLRALEIPPEGGMTGFADGVQLYEALSPELRAKFFQLNVIYDLSLMLMSQRFGMPKSFRVVRLHENSARLLEQAKNRPRGVHPAIWKRESGEYVLHVSPWQAAGIEGHENPEGDALLEALCQEMYVKMKPYFHQWKPTDMLAWDNWRFLHSVTGYNPKYARRVHRTTIKGDYGLGRFENEAAGRKPVEMTH